MVVESEEEEVVVMELELEGLGVKKGEEPVDVAELELKRDPEEELEKREGWEEKRPPEAVVGLVMVEVVSSPSSSLWSSGRWEWSVVLKGFTQVEVAEPPLRTDLEESSLVELEVVEALKVTRLGSLGSGEGGGGLDIRINSIREARHRCDGGSQKEEEAGLLAIHRCTGIVNGIILSSQIHEEVRREPQRQRTIEKNNRTNRVGSIYRMFAGTGSSHLYPAWPIRERAHSNQLKNVQTAIL